MIYYAHNLPDHGKDDWQSLASHLENVGKLAGSFATSFGARLTGELLGRLHDLGKSSKDFQCRLNGGPRTDHSTAGALHLMQSWGSIPSQTDRALGAMFGRFLAYALLGHHGGLPNTYTGKSPLNYRLSEGYTQSLPQWDSSIASPLPSPMEIYKELIPLICKDGRRPDPFRSSFAVRMLYSALVDADYLDTEKFFSPEKSSLRHTTMAISTLAGRLESYLRSKSYLQSPNVSAEQLIAAMESPCSTPERKARIRLARRYVLAQCGQAAEAEPGLFNLTVPTGGGKTLSSLSFALRHAQRHGLSRVIYVVPFTTIIEQNAALFREALGDVVLEHHSNFVIHDEDETSSNLQSLQYLLATENWEASIIVTTSVQFFESLFSARPSQCRKLHNISRSVIVLDEIQMLPVGFVAPCVEALQTLAAQYSCSIVLCTATQPALMQSRSLPGGFIRGTVRNIVPERFLPVLFEIFNRAQIHFTGKLTDKELLERLQEQSTVLCILNSRKHAVQLFSNMASSEENLFLSAGMTPVHRSQTLQCIRERLAQGLSCRLISTSLIDCGVDISFPVVYREQNGLDVLAQSAGRCNRHAEFPQGHVYVFASEYPVPSNASDLFRRLASCSLVQKEENLFSPETIQKYFTNLYGCPELLDTKGILEKASISVSSDARLNPMYAGVPRLDVEFREIEQAFQFIATSMENVVIESQLPDALASRLQSREPLSPLTLRMLQMYSVQVSLWKKKNLQEKGRLKLFHSCVYVLKQGNDYNHLTGLTNENDKEMFGL